MRIVDELNSEHVEQLYEMYKGVWFTQSREYSDIVSMLDNSYLKLGFLIDNKLIGFCRVISDGVYKAFIFDVIVKDEYQDQGVGKLIVDTILNHEKLENVKHIELYCPEKLTAFYEKFGFEIRTSLLMRKTNHR